MQIKISKNTNNAYTYYEKHKRQYHVYCAGTAFTRTTYFIIISYSWIINHFIWMLFLLNNIFTTFSTNLSTNIFLHLEFLWSKYSPASHDLSHSHSKLLGFQLNPLSHIPLYSLHSHLHLSSFHHFLLLQTLATSLHVHLQVSYYFMYRVFIVLEIRLNAFTFLFLLILRTRNFAYGSLILLQLPPQYLF